MTYLRVCLYFHLIDEIWCWTMLVNFSVQLFSSSALRFLFGSFKIFSIFVDTLTHSLIVFLRCSSSIFMMLILKSCSVNSYNSVSIGLFSGGCYCSFEWAMFPSFFMCFVTFYWDFCVWKAATSPSLYLKAGFILCKTFTNQPS